MPPETNVVELAEDTFSVLGHETRLAILFALWEHRRSNVHVQEHPMPFAELRKAVGLPDGSQFNYHLKPLLDRFVHRTEDGYYIRREGERVVSAILAGAFTDEVVFDAEPRDEPCPICGGDTVFDCNTERTLGRFAIRCTECDGITGGAGFDGVLSLTDPLLPVGARSRDPNECYRAQLIKIKHDVMSAVEGVCPDCTGTMQLSARICPDHHVDPGRRCESCDSIHEVRFDRVCDVCNLFVSASPARYLLTDARTHVYLEDHGYDPWRDGIQIALEVVDRQTVVSEDPFELAVVLDADGDRLTATIDGDGTVSDLRPGATGDAQP